MSWFYVVVTTNDNLLDETISGVTALINLDFGADWGHSAVYNYKNGHFVLGTMQLFNGMGEVVIDSYLAMTGAGVFGAGIASTEALFATGSTTSAYVAFQYNLQNNFGIANSNFQNGWNTFVNNVKRFEKEISHNLPNLKIGILTTSYAKEIAKQATKGNTRSSSVVLGNWDNGAETSYVNVANKLGTQYFQLNNWEELSSKYSNKQIWKINKAFLDNQIQANNTIIFSHNPYFAGKGSFFEREVKYLKDQGFSFEKIGDYYHAVR